MGAKLSLSPGCHGNQYKFHCCYHGNDEKSIQKQIKKKSLKPYFLSDLDKIGTKMFGKSYILWK